MNWEIRYMYTYIPPQDICIHTADSRASLVAQQSRICLQCRRCRRCGFNPWVRKIPWRRAWQPTPVFLPGESYGQGKLESCGPQGCRDLDMSE